MERCECGNIIDTGGFNGQCSQCRIKQNVNTERNPKATEVEPEQVKSLLSDVRKIANNTLYFADNSDYRAALFDILNIVTPGGILNEDGDLKERLKYIDD